LGFKKKKSLPMFALFLIALSAIGNGNAAQESHVLHINDGSFYCDVWAPLEAKTEEQFAVTVIIKPWHDLSVENVWVSLEGNIGTNGEWSKWNYTWESMTMYFQIEYKAEKTFLVRSLQSSIGYVHGTIEAHYSALGQPCVLLVDSEITKIYTRTYQELESDNNSLNQSKLVLQSNYNSLQIQLNNVNMGLYAFFATTIAFLATTIYFGVRKPKIKPS
jgi:hypothetical protein